MPAEKNETTIVTALNAAGQYDRDAAVMRQGLALVKGEFPESARLAEQFDRQAQEARDLAQKIETHGIEQAAFI